MSEKTDKDDVAYRELANRNCSGAVMAEMLNLTPRRLRQLADEGVIPKSGRDQYPLEGCVRGYIDYLRTPSAWRRW